MKPALHAIEVVVTDRNGNKVDGASVCGQFWKHERPQPALTVAGAAALLLPEDADINAIIALKSGLGFD